jgi:hypothetical protein
MLDRLSRLLALLLSVAVLVTIPSGASAQVLTRPAKAADEIVEIIMDGVLPGTTVVVFTVPPGKRLLVTDLLLSTRGGSCGFAILRNTAPATSTLCSHDRGTFSHSFLTAIEFVSGDTVSVRNDNVEGASFSNWYLRGYLARERE